MKMSVSSSTCPGAGITVAVFGCTSVISILKDKGIRPARQPAACSDTLSQGSSTRQCAQVHRIVLSRESNGDSWSDPLQATLQCHRPKQGSSQITACQRGSHNHTRQSPKTFQSLVKRGAHTWATRQFILHSCREELSAQLP